jgi:hypothetical protein
MMMQKDPTKVRMQEKPENEDQYEDDVEFKQLTT